MSPHPGCFLLQDQLRSRSRSAVHLVAQTGPWVARSSWRDLEKARVLRPDTQGPPALRRHFLPIDFPL